MFADIDFVSTKARGKFTQKTINRSNADSGQVFRTQIWERVIACLIVTAMLILGGAATINALTGMSTYAANFMIPVPVMLYTAFGGLKGTYYASFTHTAVIYLVGVPVPSYSNL